MGDVEQIDDSVEPRFNVERSCYIRRMSATARHDEILSQRELRNESGRVLRALGEGRSFVLTNRGVPVARIVPLDAPTPSLPSVRPANRVGGWGGWRPEKAEKGRPMSHILNELREDRA
ncbi:prevent-host-death family protein [Pseudoclavibacter chungangensis]|nr:prevent-host-death family protein [Pseudoclavibacter chungangensis]NYJ65996.1 prevent-host-death family protein [Pseudoclavibacter chungangensis]